MKKIFEVYGEKAVSERRTQEWFALFRSGNFDIRYALCSGRPVTEKVDEILQLVKQDRHVSCQEITEVLNIHHMTVWNYLKRARYKEKLNVWVPHKLELCSIVTMRGHISLMTWNTLTDLGWEVLMHPPNLAPSDYHFLRSLQNSFDGKKLADRRAAEVLHRWNYEAT
ncbi:histone-lysine N-methyltransferase SETMAR-like [Stegodyphus dumicola]|uniref:histone-lysine N-methyltransferase SETMAR-like n=1 Tax=Stegodyphus dumicola TaxID=202533 RepID=UPI0015AA8C68|nr:histone-lysine N-methyltransferase SETMAR-like [Stegodyphus dumicola]